MTMLEVDSLVDATVVRVGTELLLEAQGHEIFVDHSELFWPPWPPNVDLQRLYPLGSKVPVYIKGYMYALRRVLGSIKRVDPNSNPYRQLSRLDAGTVLDGHVTFLLPDPETLSVTLSNGTPGHVMPETIWRRGKQGAFKTGDSIKVVIEALDVHEGMLQFDFA
jgi:hypothetical protein